VSYRSEPIVQKFSEKKSIENLLPGMTAVSHALIGAAIAARITNIPAAAVLSVVTHLACDAIPHWDLGTNWRLRPKVVTGTLAIIETAIALLGTYFLFRGQIGTQLLVTCIICSLIPDWIEAPYYMIHPPSKFFYHMYKAQAWVHQRAEYTFGVVTQMVTVAVFLWVGFVS
jgi:hypothetical protein